MATEVVYIVRPGHDNAELRYSLRSLRNVPHGKVWIFGHRPEWCINVEHVFVPQLDPRLHKYDNSAALVQAIAERGPERFALFNDDFFCIAPVRGMPLPAHRGELLTLAEGRATAYGELLRSTARLLAAGGLGTLAYTLHAPIVMSRTGLGMAVEHGLRHRFDGEHLSWRSLYGNMMRLGGEQVEDVKVRDDGPPPPGAAWVSTDDWSFRYMTVGGVIRRALPAPSPYEQL